MKAPFRFPARRGVAIAAAVCASAVLTHAHANELYFQMNPNYNGLGQRQAFLFGAANTTGTLTSTDGSVNQTFDLGSTGFSVLTVPNNYELANATIQNNGFKIQSAGNVGGYFLSRQPFTTDMTYLIDGAKLGSQYVVAAYNQIESSYPSQVSAQATQDGTTVTFTPPGGGAATTVTLNAGQTYMFQSADTTGIGVVGNKPIAVFSGVKCANVPVGSVACDHLVEQMPSIDQLSKTYYVAPTPRTGPNGDVVRIVASADATEVKVDGVVLATLNAGEFREIRIPTGKTITADKPVLVAQYLVGQSQGGGNTDPAMTIVPGADQWLKNYVFATPSGTAAFPTDFISLLMQTSDIASLLVDGVAVADPFTALGASGFSYANIDVSATSGPFTIQAANPFQLLLSGYDNFDSYFTYGGAAFAPGASPDPQQPPGNGVPEPGTVALLGIALAGLVGMRRRKSA